MAVLPGFSERGQYRGLEGACAHSGRWAPLRTGGWSTASGTVWLVAVPDFQTLMRPLLVAVQDGEAHPIKAVRQQLAEEFGLTPDDLAEELPSGRARTFPNRVGWATTYLYRCRLLERPKRSIYRITDRGRDVLAANPDRVDLKTLSQFPESPTSVKEAPRRALSRRRRTFNRRVRSTRRLRSGSTFHMVSCERR